jgi:small GTP-binding protein
MEQGLAPVASQEYDYFAKVVVLGDAAVGKSSILRRFMTADFEESYSCTIGVDFMMKRMEVEGKRIQVQIWDTAGQERYTTITKCYLRNTHGCIVVYDITKRSTFLKVEKWIQEFNEANAFGREPSLMIVGNKIDCERNRTVSIQEGKDLAKRLNCMFYEASAKLGTNVDAALSDLVTHICLKSKGTDAPSKRSEFHVRSGSVKSAKSNKGSKCC